MKAAVIHQYGSTEVLQLEEIEQPKNKPNQLLVKVHASSVNPVDWKICKGRWRFITGNKFPMILGNVLKPNGVYVTTLPNNDYLVMSVLTTLIPGKKAKLVFEKTNTQDLVYLKELIEASKIRPVIDRIYPLQEVAAAHAYSETEHAVGKIAIAVAP